MTGMDVEEAKGPDEDKAMLAAALRLLHDLLALKQDKVCQKVSTFYPGEGTDACREAVMCGGGGCWGRVGVKGRCGELYELNRVCNAPSEARQGLCPGHAVAASRCLAWCRP